MDRTTRDRLEGVLLRTVEEFCQTHAIGLEEIASALHRLPFVYENRIEGAIEAAKRKAGQ